MKECRKCKICWCVAVGVAVVAIFWKPGIIPFIGLMLAIVGCVTCVKTETDPKILQELDDVDRNRNSGSGDQKD